MPAPLLARTIRQSVFDTPGELNPSTFFIAIVAALVITLVGSAVPARHISKLEPAEVLRG